MNGLNAPTKRQRLSVLLEKQASHKCCLQEIHVKLRDTYRLKVKGWGRSQDGRGIGRGDHFLFYKFIERTTEQWTKFTKQLLIVSSGHQAPRKAAHCLQREGKKNLSVFFLCFFLFFFFFFFCFSSSFFFISFFSFACFSLLFPFKVLLYSSIIP